MPVWRTLKGLSQHDTPTREGRHSAQDGASSSVSSTNPGDVAPESGEGRSHQAAEPAQDRILVKGTNLGKSLAYDNSLPQPPPPPPYIRLAPSSPTETNSPTPPDENYPSLIKSLQTFDTNRRTSCSFLSPYSALLPTQSLSEVSINIPYLSPNKATIEDDHFSNSNNSIQTSSLMSNVYASSSHPIGNMASAPATRRSSRINSIGHARSRSNSLAASRRASRNNSIALLPGFPLPSATQLSNTAALGDIATPGPESPNVFR